MEQEFRAVLNSCVPDGSGELSEFLTRVQGCWALFNLSLDDAGEVAVAQKGGIEAVVHAMGAHRSSVGIQVTGHLAPVTLFTTLLALSSV